MVSISVCKRMASAMSYIFQYSEAQLASGGVIQLGGAEEIYVSILLNGHRGGQS